MIENDTLDVQVRSALLHDCEAVLQLARDFATSFTVDGGTFGTTYRELLQQVDARLLVAESEGLVVGYCLAFDHLALFANGRVTWVEELMVQEDVRRAGVGTQLMLATEGWASERRSQLIGLATRRAASFYTAMGYEESATYFRKLISS